MKLMNKDLVIEELVSRLLEAKEAYYNQVPIMNDSLFDQLEDDLRKLDPNNKYFSIVGTNVKGSSNIKHRIPMLSCGKAKTVDELSDWMKKIGYTSDFVCMPKIDGLSCSIEYVNGKISCISTRGDGEVGQDITWLKDFLNIPQSIEDFTSWQEIRGEIYLPKDTKLETNGKPLRNIAAGLVNRKDDKTNCEYLKFVAYQLYESSNNTKFFTQDLDLLLFFGFDVVSITNSNCNDVEFIRNQYLNKWRSEWKYETDGLVFQYNDKTKYEEIDSHYTIDHHSFFRWALKPPSEEAETTHKSIEWNTSKSGDVVPTAIFDEVILGSRRVSRAKIDNYSNVVNLSLAEGDTIVVSLRNDVIPHLERVVKHNGGKINIPEVCPSCGHKLSIEQKTSEDTKDPVLYLMCNNVNCSAQIIKRITDYCSRCEMDSISEATITKLYETGYLRVVSDLYSLHEFKNELLQIDGFGISKVLNLLKQIEKSKNQTELQFMSNLGIDGVHEKGLIKLGINTLEDFFNFNDNKYINGQKVINFKKENKLFIEEMIQLVQLKKEEPKMNNKSKGKVCMTGKGFETRQILEAKLFQMGYDPVDSVTKDTSILVVDDLASTSSKMLKAQKLGIKVLKYEEFFK